MTASGRNIGGSEFSPIAIPDLQESDSIDRAQVGQNLVLKSPGLIIVRLEGVWYRRECRISDTDSLFTRALHFLRVLERDRREIHSWVEQDRLLFPADEGLFCQDPEERVWWFHTPDKSVSYAVGTHHIWRVEERYGIPKRYARDSVERSVFVSRLLKGRSPVRGIDRT